jgi:hypothetical protein
VGLNARGVQDGKSFADGGTVARGLLAGSRVIDKRNTLHREFPLGADAGFDRRPGAMLLIFAPD